MKERVEEPVEVEEKKAEPVRATPPPRPPVPKPRRGQSVQLRDIPQRKFNFLVTVALGNQSVCGQKL